VGSNFVQSVLDHSYSGRDLGIINRALFSHTKMASSQGVSLAHDGILRCIEICKLNSL